jgi:hypothetical protein
MTGQKHKKEDLRTASLRNYNPKLSSLNLLLSIAKLIVFSKLYKSILNALDRGAHLGNLRLLQLPLLITKALPDVECWMGLITY